MTELFYIDRQFGQAIYVDVENGIVQKCYNETEKFNARMNELYKGKSIMFLKIDFEERMKPSYHNVRSANVVHEFQKINALNNRIKSFNVYLEQLLKPTPEYKRYIADHKKEIKKELKEVEKQLETEKKRMLSEHNYTV